MTDLPPMTQSGRTIWGERLREHIAKIFTWKWIFETPLEKIIVALALCWGIYSFVKFGGSLIGGLL